jgi:hypothetical protein
VFPQIEHHVTMSSPLDVIAIITPKPGKADRVRSIATTTPHLYHTRNLTSKRCKSSSALQLKL